MVNRKITLLFTALFVNVAIYAQTDWGWDWKDSSKVSVKDKPQQTEFLNNSFPYPAKPQNQAELGFGLGYGYILGNVNAGIGANLDISYRKALGHVLSYRVSYDYAYSTGKANNVQTQMIGYRLAYRNKTQALSLDALISLNTLSFYRGNPKFNIYGLVGYSLEATNLQVDRGTGTYREFYYPSSYGPHSDGLITSFGTKYGPGGVGSTVISQGIDIGGGISYKVNNKINVGLEQKYIISSNPFQDGYNNLPSTNIIGQSQVSYSQEIFSFTDFRVNINIGNTATKVQPLWWINPNNYIYNELNNPRHMKLPKPNLQDSDGDGVIDQFDLEPNTPAGSPVDSHGVSLDTDGDGVPDYKDKEKLTLQKCFPVNNDGIGVCPEPSCCKEIKELLASGAYNTGGNSDGNGVKKTGVDGGGLGDLPSIQFNSSSNKLSKSSEKALDDIAKKLNENPDSKIKLIGYGAASKAAQQLSWERVNAIKKYLVEKKGIAENRIIFTYGQTGTNGGDANTVDIQGTTEDGPSNVPAPHPNLSKKSKGAGTHAKAKKK